MSIAQNFPAIAPSLLLDFANTEVLDQRITFARATTGTCYGTRTALAEQNLLQYSQEFDNAYWTKDNVILTANAIVAPDGTTTAENIVANTTLTFHRAFRSFTLSAGEYTFSVYVKSNGLQWVGLRTNSVRSFDIINGVVGAGSINATISNAGNGWFRCTITETTANPVVAIQLSDVDTSTTNPVFAGDDISGVYLWGAQLEQRSTVTAYNVTTTQPITNYIPVLETAALGVARFDHNPTTFESLGLLVEQQSTNLVLRSEEFDNASWTKINATITANTVIAPDGNLSGDLFIPATSSDLRQTITFASATYTVSIYVKKYSLPTLVGLNFTLAGTANANGTVNIETGDTIGAAGANFVSGSSTFIGNGWYRVSATIVNTFVGSTTLRISPRDSSNNPITGDGYSGIYIWGAQLEALALSTSYIATVASQVTRAADAASMTGTNFSSWYAQGEGTLYVESLSQNTVAANNKNVRFSDGTISNEIWLGSSAPGTGARSQITLGGVLYFDSSLANQVTASVFGKYAVSFETNNAVLCANGTLGTVDTAVVISSAINQFAINPPGLRAGYYKKIAYYPIAVTSAQLQALTG